MPCHLFFQFAVRHVLVAPTVDSEGTSAGASRRPQDSGWTYHRYQVCGVDSALLQWRRNLDRREGAPNDDLPEM